jgi:hypothetical protein
MASRTSRGALCGAPGRWAARPGRADRPDAAPGSRRAADGAEVASEAARLGEVAGGFEDPEIEEVILLTDLSREAPAAIGKPKWTPVPALGIQTPEGAPISLLKPRP